MKKATQLFFWVILSALQSIAQPNSGFENWSTEFSYENPDDWQTLNFLSLTTPPNPLSAFKAIGLEKYAGNYSLIIKTIYINNNPIPGSVADTFGCVFKGKITISPASIREGFPYTARPEKLQFYSKYTPVGNDIAGAVALLKKQNINTGAIDTIAVGSIDIAPTVQYTLFTINLEYRDNINLPDSAVIAFYSSRDPSAARIGSALYVDDVLFSGWVGINEYEKTKNAQVKIFPNPANEYITIHSDIPMADNIQIIDVSGKFVTNCIIDKQDFQINTSALGQGTYFYEIRTKEKMLLTSGKFNILK